MRIILEALVDLAVQMNRQVRDYADRASRRIEHFAQSAFASQEDAAGQGEGAVEPPRENGAAVDLDGDSEHRAGGLFGAAANLQTGAVGMGSRHDEAFGSERPQAGPEGHDRRRAARDIICGSRLEVPCVFLVQLDRPMGGKAHLDIVRRMIRRRRGVQKITEAFRRVSHRNPFLPGPSVRRSLVRRSP